MKKVGGKRPKREGNIMRKSCSTRRQFIKTSALATTAVLAAPYVKTAHSAGTLSLGLWDHWVPGANEVLSKICKDWGEANGLDVTVDFITSIGFKNILTAQAEARAKSGHDMLAHPTWQISVHRDSLEPVDDVVAEITAKHGPYIPAANYLAQFDGSWRAIPAPTGSHTYPMVSRIDLFKQHAGIDLTELSWHVIFSPGVAAGKRCFCLDGGQPYGPVIKIYIIPYEPEYLRSSCSGLDITIKEYFFFPVCCKQEF